MSSRYAEVAGSSPAGSTIFYFAFKQKKENLTIVTVRNIHQRNSISICQKIETTQIQKIIRSNDTNTSLLLDSIRATTSVSSSILTVTNITASGNISASGTVIANNFQSDGQDQITVADAFNITGSITSSGDISASGDVIANTGSFNLIEGGVF